VAGSCENGNNPSGFIKCWLFLGWMSFSRKIRLHGVRNHFQIIYLYSKKRKRVRKVSNPGILRRTNET
jgi:hypothetical protein